MRLRRLSLLLLVLVVYTGVLMVLATLILCVLLEPVSGWGEWIDAIVPSKNWIMDDGFWWAYCGTPVLVLVVSQMIFLVPVAVRRPRLGERSRSLIVSLVVAGLIAGALTAGLVYALTDLAALGDDVDRIAVWDLSMDPSDPAWIFALRVVRFPLILIPVSWLIWTMLLIAFARRRVARGRWGRLLGLLLGGTILELLIVTPIDVMVRRRTDCYCATGTFHAFILGAFALCWLAGPGIIVALTSRRRRLWRDSHCAMCGYERGPSPGPCCPECGEAWGP